MQMFPPGMTELNPHKTPTPAAPDAAGVFFLCFFAEKLGTDIPEAGILALVAQDQQVLFDVRAALPRIADRDERRGVIPVPADVEARRVGRGVNLGCEIAQNWPRRASASRCEGRGKG